MPLRWRQAWGGAIISLVAAGNVAHSDQMKFVSAGSQVTLFKAQNSPCEAAFIPDAPARAFRRADGNIALFATHLENWALIGPSFDMLRPDCHPILRSSDYSAQSMGNMWIEALYTRDGRNIVALASQDLTPIVKAAGCDAYDIPGHCWLNNIIAVQSNDMGHTFVPLSQEQRLVASLGRDYRSSNKERFGYFTASNIVMWDGFFYVIMYAQGENVQPAGNCLFRTSDPFDAQSWMGWDGSDFTVIPRPTGDTVQACRVIGRDILTHEVRSLVYVTSVHLWVATFMDRLRLAGDPAPIPGSYMSTSSDLLGWSAPTRIMAAPITPRRDSNEVMTAYPSILDPKSHSQNFETIDSPDPVLLFTVQRLNAGRGTMNRDLNYVRLRME